MAQMEQDKRHTTGTVATGNAAFVASAKRIFIAYSTRDNDLREELEAHLDLLRREGLVDPWHSGLVSPGAPWEETVRKQLDRAHFILLLITKDFLASDHCYGVELAVSIRRHRNGATLVMPILARACDPGFSAYFSVPVFPRNGTPVAAWPDRDNAWAQIVAELRAATSGSPLRSARQPVVTVQSPWPKTGALDWKSLFLITFVALVALLVGLIIARPSLLDMPDRYGIYIDSARYYRMGVPVALSPLFLLLVPVVATWRSHKAFDFAGALERPAVTHSAPLPGERPTSIFRPPACAFCGWLAAPEAQLIVGPHDFPRCVWCAALHAMILRARSQFRVTSFFAVGLSIFLLLYGHLRGDAAFSAFVAFWLGLLYAGTIGRMAARILIVRCTPKGDNQYTISPAQLQILTSTEARSTLDPKS